MQNNLCRGVADIQPPCEWLKRHVQSQRCHGHEDEQQADRTPEISKGPLKIRAAIRPKYVPFSISQVLESQRCTGYRRLPDGIPLISFTACLLGSAQHKVQKIEACGRFVRATHLYCCNGKVQPAGFLALHRLVHLILPCTQHKRSPCEDRVCLQSWADPGCFVQPYCSIVLQSCVCMAPCNGMYNCSAPHYLHGRPDAIACRPSFPAHRQSQQASPSA